MIRRALAWLIWELPLVGRDSRYERRWTNGGRTCAACGLTRELADTPTGDDGPDPCLGRLPGVMFACCGHGQRAYAYVAFSDGTTIRGFDQVQSRSRR